MKKIIVITAPSGSGKTTIIKKILDAFDNLEFSISACTRAQRENEVDGKDYNFISPEEFEKHIKEDSFFEYEMVYTGKYYGTLKSELQRITDMNKTPVLDLDVIGAAKVKDIYQDDIISIFIKPPSLEVLKMRLIERGTETDASLNERVDKAAHELEYESKFDHILINTDLYKCYHQAIELIKNILTC